MSTRNTQDSPLHRFKLFRLLILLCLVVLLGIILLLVCGEMEETVSGRGEVEALFDYRIRSTVDAKIVKINKKEGQAVKKGDLLLTLEDRELKEEIIRTRSQIAELQGECDVQQNQLHILRNDPLPERYRNVAIALDEASKKTEKSQARLETYSKLYQRKVISRKDFEEVELENIRNTAERQKAQEDYHRVEAGLGRKIIAKAENQLRLLQTRLENQRTMLRQQEQRLNDYRILAPDNGIVSQIPDLPGGFLKAGDQLARISSVNQRKFVVHIDQSTVHKVKNGQNARILSDSYNYFEYGYFAGRVIKVAELPQKIDGRFLYPVEVLVTSEPFQLKLGSTADIKIITGREKIFIGLLGHSR